jgi:hypothetical protein
MRISNHLQLKYLVLEIGTSKWVCSEVPDFTLIVRPFDWLACLLAWAGESGWGLLRPAPRFRVLILSDQFEAKKKKKQVLEVSKYSSLSKVTSSCLNATFPTPRSESRMCHKFYF